MLASCEKFRSSLVLDPGSVANLGNQYLLRHSDLRWKRAASGYTDGSEIRITTLKPTQTGVKVGIAGGGPTRWKEGVSARNVSQVPKIDASYHLNQW